MSIWALLATIVGLAVAAIVLAPIAAGWITMNRKSDMRRGEDEPH